MGIRVLCYRRITDDMICYCVDVDIQIFIAALKLFSVLWDSFNNAADKTIKSII